MIYQDGKRVCDKEIRSRSGKWRACRAPAQYRVMSKVVPYLELDYCAKHAPQAKTAKVSP